MTVTSHFFITNALRLQENTILCSHKRIQQCGQLPFDHCPYCSVYPILWILVFYLLLCSIHLLVFFIGSLVLSAMYLLSILPSSLLSLAFFCVLLLQFLSICTISQSNTHFSFLIFSIHKRLYCQFYCCSAFEICQHFLKI